MPRSQNGWSANDITQTDVQLIPGTKRKIRLRKGDAGWLLRRVAAFIDREVENIDEATQDDWGYAERPIRGSTTTLSNHASGTAIDVNATKHGLGVTGTWSAAEKAKIHAHLKEYDGVIRWGEDYTGRKDGMHFEINKDAAAVAAVARKLRAKDSGVKPPAPKPAEDKSIALSAVQYGARGGYFHSGQKEALSDVTAVMRWCVRLGVITEDYYGGWQKALSAADWKRSGVLITETIKALQRRLKLTPDGIFGPVTGGKMKGDGYTVIGLDGKKL